ncbi:hypothetical protein PQX77_000811 [Marasmius sp. AFHP31]|nr:hypothetical protein PQX77_000811 [Marasmius sp. AFHP31]
MEKFNGLLLDDDTINHMLTFLPDFDSLKATILATRLFYNVYKAHPNSIRRAVAANVVGRALPEALRVVRDRGPYDIEPKHEGEADESFITNKEIPELVENARKFRVLEDVFSLRHKNRKFKKSQLTYDESSRFQRAIYMLALYSKAFPGPDLLEAFNGKEGEEYEEFQIEKRTEQIEFLRRFSVQDLRQMHTVSMFLIELVHWARGNDDEWISTHDTGKAGLALSCGPNVIYRCYYDGSLNDLKDEFMWENDANPPHFFNGYLAEPLSKLLEERGFKGPSEDATHWSSVVDDAVGVHDPCARCNEEGGFNLWGPSTYEYLCQTAPYLAPDTDLDSVLIGNLSNNPVEMYYFAGFIEEIPKHENIYKRVILDLLNSDYKILDWKPDDWFCTECLTKFFEENLHLWLHDKKIQAGVEIPNDCQYGWNCHMQIHRFEHSNKLNVNALSSYVLVLEPEFGTLQHICEPTKSV